MGMGIGDNVNFSFPRYFEGGKLKINDYSLTSLDNKSFTKFFNAP